MADLIHVVAGGGLHHSSGPYSAAVVGAGLCFVSCQLATDPATGELADGGFEAQADQALDNVSSVLRAASTTWERIVSVSVLLSDVSDAGRFNDRYRRRFADDGPFPARVMYQAGQLGPGALVGVAAIALANQTKP